MPPLVQASLGYTPTGACFRPRRFHLGLFPAGHPHRCIFPARPMHSSTGCRKPWSSDSGDLSTPL